jgi:hypothetical protein
MYLPTWRDNSLLRGECSNDQGDIPGDEYATAATASTRMRREWKGDATVHEPDSSHKVSSASIPLYINQVFIPNDRADH